jgi:D-cysteine desulfhydrase
MGGSSWLGAVGFVNAGLELAQQIAAGEISAPSRIYMANGTMGSCAGLSLGLALAELPIELQVVRVVDERFASPPAFRRLQQKTATMLRRLDPSVPANLATRARFRWRDEFFAGGYAVSDAVTRSAVERAATALGLMIETTYTGKAMAALLHDLDSPGYDGGHYLFWNTYNSQPLPVTGARPPTRDNVPEEFMRYYD